MASFRKLLFVALARLTAAQQEYIGSTYGGNRDLSNFTYHSNPLGNQSLVRGEEYNVAFAGFNWSDQGPAQDNGAWSIRFLAGDVWLPSNLSSPGEEKAVITSYSLRWEGDDVYGNLSAKLGNDTSALQSGGNLQMPPTMCLGVFGYETDWADDVKRNMDLNDINPCESMMGTECFASLRQAFSSPNERRACGFGPAALDDDLSGCENTFNRRSREGISTVFLANAIGNGSQASNASYSSPQSGDQIFNMVQLHAAEDNSTWERESARVQFVVIYESGKEAQVICTRLDNSGVRVLAGASILMMAGIILALAREIV